MGHFRNQEESLENCAMVGSWTGSQKGEAKVSYSEHLARLPMVLICSPVLHIFVCGAVLNLVHYRQGQGLICLDFNKLGQG